jgi:hypothetical protein
MRTGKRLSRIGDVRDSPAGESCPRRWLCSQCVVIIVCDYIEPYLFYESVGTSACNQRFNYPRRTRFAPIFCLSCVRYLYYDLLHGDARRASAVSTS